MGEDVRWSRVENEGVFVFTSPPPVPPSCVVRTFPSSPFSASHFLALTVSGARLILSVLHFPPLSVLFSLVVRNISRVPLQSQHFSLIASLGKVVWDQEREIDFAVLSDFPLFLLFVLSAASRSFGLETSRTSLKTVQ